MPAAAACMVCHRAVRQENAAIRALAALPRDARPFAAPHKLPDFVFFSHGRHAIAKVACTYCHGPMQADAEPRIDAKMKVCIDCHRGRRASIACTVCHELSQ